jgi:hypothetical protein
MPGNKPERDIVSFHAWDRIALGFQNKRRPGNGGEGGG